MKYDLGLGECVVLGYDNGKGLFGIVKHHKGFKIQKQSTSRFDFFKVPIKQNTPFSLPDKLLLYNEEGVEKIDGVIELTPY